MWRTDAIDQSVLSCLLADARATCAEIGDVVGLSAPAVKRRVDRLRETGAIRGFTALVDPAALGWSTEAFVEISCEGTVAPAALRASLEQVPEVVGACTVSGSTDALVHLRGQRHRAARAGERAGARRAGRRLHAQRDRAVAADRPAPPVKDGPG